MQATHRHALEQTLSAYVRFRCMQMKLLDALVRPPAPEALQAQPELNLETRLGLFRQSVGHRTRGRLGNE
jgi:hypothetical protein